MSDNSFESYYWSTFETVSGPVKLNGGNKIDLCATVIKSRKKGNHLLDVRIWKDGVPTRSGIYFAVPVARSLRGQLDEYLKAEGKPDVIKLLGYDPFEN